ncbi:MULTISPECIES: flavodoxin family protein [unclassified Agarivorans]|uniref:flavodoxin family protein n=1 Tax=unclassified Agarivorans TaxID=2636026 RepID=UPI003D7D0B9E
MKVAVVYYSKTDITRQLAQAIIEGLKTQACIEVLEHCITGKEIIAGRFQNKPLFESILSCDALIMGTPTYMGGVSAQFKAFADASSEYWSEQQWANKLAAGFTCGSALNGDQSSTLQYLTILASQHGMYWLGLDTADGYRNDGLNRLGCQLGLVAQSRHDQVNPVDLATAKYLGKRVSNLLFRLNKVDG